MPRLYGPEHTTYVVISISSDRLTTALLVTSKRFRPMSRYLPVILRVVLSPTVIVLIFVGW